MACRYRSSSLLVSASNLGDFETVKRLLKQGADVNQKDENLQCALFRAAWRGHFQVARLILQYQAQVSLTNGRLTYSALIVACQTGHVNLAKLLLDYGADVEFAVCNIIVGVAHFCACASPLFSATPRPTHCI
jgi:ankyrin repeat protein